MSAAPLSVIVFAFDEAQNVAAVLGELCAWLREHEPDAELIFVDDGSRDGTLEAARAALQGSRHRLVRHEHNRGIGAAIKSGVACAEGEFVTFLPADGQIEPAAIGTLRAAQRATGSEVVFSIYADRDDGRRRKLLSWGVRALILLVHGVRMNSDGPYLFRRSAFEAERLPPDSFFLNFEFPIRVLARGATSATVEIRCRKRFAGQSKSTGWRRIAGVTRELLDLRVRRLRESLERRSA